MSPVSQGHAGNSTRGSSVSSYIGQFNLEYPQKSPLILQSLDIMIDAGGPTSFATRTQSQVSGSTTPNLSNANGSFNFFPPSNLHIIVYRNNYQGTTIPNGTTLFICKGVCVAGAVVAAIVVFCLSFGLFLCLGRRNMNRWIKNYYGGQRRTNPSVINTPTRLDPERSRVSTASIELPPLPQAPYPGNHLPPYSLFDSDASINDANASSETDNESSDAVSATEFSIAPEDTNSEVTSVGNDNEFPVPPTPLIPTIPLPLLSSNNHIPQHDSSSDSASDHGIHQGFLADQPVNNDNSSGDYNSNFNIETIGSLGLIFE